MGGLLSAKFLFVLFIGLVVLGPEKLPEVARTAGRLIAEFRRVTTGLQTEVREALDSSELAAPVKEFRAVADSLRTGLVGPLVGSPAPDPPVVGASPGPASAAAPSAVYPGLRPAAAPRLWTGDLGPPPGDPSLN